MRPAGPTAREGTSHLDLRVFFSFPRGLLPTTPVGHPEVGPGEPMLSFIGERIENGDEVTGTKQIIDPEQMLIE